MSLELLKSTPQDGAQRKADDAYKTISEVASELDIPQHVLRFWESHFPQVKPSRMRGSRRYYRPEDIDLLKQIKTLLYAQGYTIKGAKKLIKENRVAVEKPAVVPVAAPVQQAAPPAPQKKANKADIKSLANELRVLKTMLAALI